MLYLIIAKVLAPTVQMIVAFFAPKAVILAV